MYNILIDIGNTACKVAISCNGAIETVGRTAEEKDVPPMVRAITDGTFMRSVAVHADMSLPIKSAMDEIAKGIKPASIVIATVRNRSRKFESALKNAFGKETVLNFDIDFVRKILSSDITRNRYPKFKVLENMPDGMGADRLAAILAAHIRCPESKLMVFDFGTATTIEFIDRDYYEGGSISLGLNTRYRALSAFTKKIPLLSPNTFLAHNNINKIDTIGYDLDTALAAGNILGIIFEIEGYIKHHPDREVFFTGGDSEQLAKRIDRPVNVVADLVLEGLNYIATRRNQKQ